VKDRNAFNEKLGDAVNSELNLKLSSFVENELVDEESYHSDSSMQQQPSGFSSARGSIKQSNQESSDSTVLGSESEID
jgi:hypothetical protein